MLEINTIDNPGFSVKYKINNISDIKAFEKINYKNKFNNWEKFHWDYETNMDYSYFFDDWYSIEIINDEIICYGDPLKLSFLIKTVEKLVNIIILTQNEYEILNWLSNWYKIECNGDWEHSYGTSININSDTVFIEIDIEDTRFDKVTTMNEINQLLLTSDWINIKIYNQKFIGQGDRSKLNQIIEKFRELHELNQFLYRSE